MAHKIFSLIVIIIAVVMGILASALPGERLADLVLISKFFLSMVPVLVVGALIKYLIMDRYCKCCGSDSKTQ